MNLQLQQLHAQRIEKIRLRLVSALLPEHLEITNESHLHEGHAGAAGGAGHYAVEIIADAFRGQGKIMRHRAIYNAVADMMPEQIHALRINALSSDEI